MKVEQRYVVRTACARAPSKFWGHARVVRVLDTTSGPNEYHWVRKGVVKQWGDQYSGRGTWHLDARYDGPRSAYGRALREAEALAAELNGENR